MTLKNNISKKALKDDLDKIIRSHVLASVGTGMIPLPIVDLAGLMGIQLNMIKKIAEVYSVPFFEEAAEKTLMSLVSYILMKNFGVVAISAIKAIPIVGQAIGSIAMPTFCGASTYASGKMFMLHFDSGGTFYSFDEEKVKNHYASLYKDGKKMASEIKKDIKPIKNQDEN